MGTAKKAIVPPERRRWEQTYNNLAHLLRTQQIQLETLLKARKLLERRIKTQHERWESVVRVTEDQIFQIKRDMAIEGSARLLQTVKSDLMAGLAQRETARLKLMLDCADTELTEDHKNFLDALKQKSSQTTDLSERYSLRSNKKKGFKSEDSRSEVLESEVIELRKEYDKLSLKKNAEVSALLLEKDFVWHQLKTLENDYADKLRKKSDEIDSANEKVANLIARMEELQSSNSDKDKTIQALESKIAKMEELQSSNSDKDKTIQALESKIAKMEADAASQRNEMSRVNYQLETLKKSANAAASPSLRPCSTELMKSNLGPKSNELSRNRVRVKKEQSERKGPNLADHSGEGSTGLKRKMIDVITIPDTPKLFSASFKAPKLKQSSPYLNASRQNRL